jgi:hypothetical protein
MQMLIQQSIDLVDPEHQAQGGPSLITKRSMHALDLCAAAIATTVLVAAAVVSSRADDVSPKIDISDSDLGGVVTGPAGPRPASG